jgi:transposase
MQDRSMIVLMLASGKSYDEVMQKVRVSRSVVAKWKNRFLAMGMVGPRDKAGRGKEPEYDADDEARVVELATGKTNESYLNRSQQQIAEELKMSKSTVQRILARHRFKSKRSKIRAEEP